jgi:hypothetical protein
VASKLTCLPEADCNAVLFAKGWLRCFHLTLYGAVIEWLNWKTTWESPTWPTCRSYAPALPACSGPPKFQYTLRVSPFMIDVNPLTASFRRAFLFPFTIADKARAKGTTRTRHLLYWYLMYLTNTSMYHLVYCVST